MQQRTFSPFIAAVLGVAAATCLASCSLALDTQKVQCSRSSDCASLIGGRATQQCVKSFCQPVTCATTTECQAREGDAFKTSYCDDLDLICKPAECAKSEDCSDGQVCEIGAKRCLAANRAACVMDPDCDKYEGLATYICESRFCDVPECRKDSDCGGMGTPVCLEGRCGDPVFGCVGERDIRPEATMPKATFKIKVLNVLDMTPVKNLSVRACAPAQLDTECVIPLAGTEPSYDEATGELTVSGLVQDAAFRLVIEPKDMTPPLEELPFLPIDLYSQRLPRDITEETNGPVFVVPFAIVASLESAFPTIKVNLENGTLIMRVFDCGEPPLNAKGVSFAVTEPRADTEVFYLEGLIVNPDAPSTSASGSGGVVNAKPGNITVTATRGSTLISSFDVRLRPKRLTYVNLHPRDYNR